MPRDACWLSPILPRHSSEQCHLSAFPLPLWIGPGGEHSRLHVAGEFTATAGTTIGLGIQGTFNTSGNDGTITRFGWKAQNKSLMIFAGEAYNVERGFQRGFPEQERAGVPGCVFNGSTPDDDDQYLNPDSSSANYKTPLGTANEMSSDMVNFSALYAIHGPTDAGSAK